MVICDNAEAPLHKEKRLAVPKVAMQKYYDRAFAPVLIVDFGVILGGDRV